MNYRFSEDIFKQNFNWKSTETNSADTCRITHHHSIRFKLFPYVASGTTPIVTDMTDVIGDFIKLAIGIDKTNTDFDNLVKKVLAEIEVKQEDEEALKQIIRSLFYRDNELVADNIGLYAYKGSAETTVEKIAQYLNNVLDITDEDATVINDAMQKYPYNALEKLVTECLEADSPLIKSKEKQRSYYRIFEDAAQQFKKDFHFMLKNGMSTPEDLADLLSLYYYYYTAQTCIILDNFGNGSRSKQTELYFALDWEKVSTNRNCCKGGWKKLEQNVRHIFSHAITLELINQIEGEDVEYDYIKLSDCIEKGLLDDNLVADEIVRIEKIYTESIGDVNSFNSISSIDSKNKTDAAVQHLFKCVDFQFNKTNRKAANEKFIRKLEEFYRSRWLKNRKKAGLVLNLTERDVIFLTKISIQDRDRIRLVDLFREYEKRGIFLDNISRSLLQEFFTRLNLLDKKSDSGDAQYVKRIL